MAGRSDIEAGAAFVRLYVKKSDFAKGLKSASDSLKSWGTGIATAGAAISGLGGSIIAGIGAAAKSFADTGSELADMSARTGMSTEALSELGYAASMTGANLGDVEKSTRKMQQVIADAAGGSQQATDKLAAMGLTLADLAGLSPDEQMMRIAEALGAMTDPAKRTAAAMDVFGKTGTSLLPMFADGADGLQAMRDEAKGLGLSISSIDAAAADELGDAFDRVKMSIAGAVFRIGAAVAGPLTEFFSYVTRISGAVSEWINRNRTLFTAILGVGVGLSIAGTVLVGFGTAIWAAGAALGGLVTVLAALSAPIAAVAGALISGPGLVVAAIAAGIVAWATMTTSGQEAMSGIAIGFQSLWGTITETWGGIVSAVQAGDLALAGQIAVTGLQVALLDGVAAIAGSVGGAWGDFIGTLLTQLVTGDLSGAWSTIMNSMAATWDAWSAGIVSAFTSTIRAVIDVWESAVSTIAGWILKLQGLSGAELEQAKGFVAEDLSGKTASAKQFLDEMASAATAQAGASAATAATGTSGGATAASALADEKRKQLEQLAADARDMAATQQAERDRQKALITPPGEITPPGIAGGAAVTFSAAALQALGGAGGGPQEKIARLAEEQKKLQQKMVEQQERLIELAGAGTLFV